MIDVQIDYAADGSCQLQLWAKGTHSTEEFLSACEKAVFAWDERQVSLAGKPVIQSHWRTVPVCSCGVCKHVRQESRPGRGAYAVTVLNEGLPLRGFHTKQPHAAA